MTDYAQAAATEPSSSWTSWWMTTAAAAAAAMRMRNLHGGDDEDDRDEAYDDGGPDRRKRQRVTELFDRRTFGNDDGSSCNEPAAPLDLSVRATLRPAGAHDVIAATPVKRPAAASATGSGKSSKKTSGKTTTGGSGHAAAVRAATRKLLPQLDQPVDRSSPVSGTIIVPASSREGSPGTTSRYASVTGTTSPAGHGDDAEDGYDIDPEFNVVVATDEARRLLDSIPNTLGPYRCRLCGVQYADAFALARHRCRCIVHVRYRCPECDKVFQCPANLASHRRWHGTGTANAKTASSSNRNKNGGGGDDKLESAETTTTTVPATSAVAGFKKNILQRAVQAAAAAAAANNNNNNNNEVNT